MTPERWQRICDIFDAASERDSDAEEYARAECGADAEMYAEVHRMLREHRRKGPLDRAPIGVATARGARGPVFSEGQLVAGRYRIVRYISHGGMGEVYEAADLDLNERDALKTLLPEIAADERMIARFKQEIALSRKISSPYVCRVFDLARHEIPGAEPILFLTMEFLPGETLAERLQRAGPMTPAAALPLVEQMCAALDAAHDAGVVHRDFKPSNVMLAGGSQDAAAERAVVTDFGLARRLVSPGETTPTLSAGVMGTLDYMAPELLSGSIATFRSDVYALGMTVYKMVTGVLPFAGETPLAGAIRRSKTPVPPPRFVVPDLDPRWDGAIVRALNADPQQRFARAGDFLHAVRGEPVSATTIRLPAMSRRRWLGVAAAVLAGIGGALGWSAWERAQNRPSPEAERLYRTGVDDIQAGAYFAATKALGKAVQMAPSYPLGRARLAEAWLELEMPEKAGEQMLLAKRLDAGWLSEAERLRIAAIDFTITRDFPEAVSRYEKVARLEGRDNPGVFVDLGRAYEKAGKPKDAVDSYRRAVQIQAALPAAWLKLGVQYARQSGDKSSDDAFSKATELYEMTSNQEGLTEVTLQRGIAANSRGRLPAAAEYLKKALDTARNVGNFQQEINATLRLGINAYLSGDTAAAENYARSALESARSHQMETMAIRGLINLGTAFMVKQDFAKAEQHYQEALEMAQRNNSGHLTALGQLSMASLHALNRHPEDAVREAQAALAYYAPNRYLRETLQAQTIIARIKRDDGDYAGALEFFRQALHTAETGQDAAMQAFMHENIGGVLFNQDRFPEALEQYQKELALAPDPEHVGYAELACGNTLWRLGRYGEADAMFTRVEGVAPRFARLRFLLAEGRAAEELSRNHEAEAVKEARDALGGEAGRSPGMQAAFKEVLGLGLLRSGSRKQGLSLVKESAAADAALQDASAAMSAQVSVIEGLVENGQNGEAVKALQQVEPKLKDYPELQWRAFALASRVDGQYKARAAQALDQLSGAWGAAAMKDYLARPDIQQFSRPLSGAVPAKSQ